MATTVTSIFSRVRHLLVDANGDRWTDAELLAWLAEAQQVAVIVKPDAYTRRESFTCAAGTLQTLPAGGVQILDVIRNLSGNLRAIRKVARFALDTEQPNWHSAPPSDEIRAFTTDERDPKTFYVYPPALLTPDVADTPIEILYSKTPPAPTMAGSIALDDVYAAPLIDYVAHRAFSKDAENQPSMDRAMTHYQRFIGALVGKQAVEATEAPVIANNASAVPE